jgi:sterol desaturase/sphingolipid hydroxylase (fatty acid hydroxylase superfamily)
MIEAGQIPLVMTVGGIVLLMWLEHWRPAAAQVEVMGHAWRNIRLGVLNGVGLALIAGPLLAAVSGWVVENEVGLVRRLDGPWRLGLGLLLFDGWMYVWHRVNHESRLLWRFHRLHHSDEAMDVTTTIRFHPGEIALSTLARLLVMPLLGLTVGELLIYEMVMFPVILVHHSNIRFPEWLDRGLRWLIVTPALHRIHHSNIQIETDSNYGSVLSVWDRVAGSFRRRTDGRPVEFGLGDPTRLNDQISQ